jgi:hypothetical protein
MQALNTDRGDETEAKDEIDISGAAPAERPRGRDRRNDFSSLFGGYSGPERRSGRDRRTDA